MSDNPQVSRDTFFALGFGVVALSGPDAVKFAHAQFMSDVARLADGHWQWSGWLTPKGRVIALFALLRLDARTLWLLLPDSDADELAAQLRRFVFRSKLAIEGRDDLVARGAFVGPSGANASAIGGGAAQGVALDLGADGGPRTIHVGTEHAPEDAAALARWMRFDLEHGLPRLDDSQREQWTPQMLSLERLHAFSVKKGCYPGQEIVARTHFLGQAKRGLAALSASAPIGSGADVELDGAVVGRVVASTLDPPCLALAVLPLERADGPLRAGGLVLHDVTLRGGLAR